MIAILAVIVAFVLIIGNELWTRRHNTRGEFSRKFLHVTVGTVVAFWPFVMTWQQIELLSFAFFIVISISKYFNLFQAIHSVQRPTLGELFFALSVGVIALMTHDKWIYVTALLQMSLADGLAAVVGVKYGKSHRYKVLGHQKSLAGSLTFLLISIGLLVMYCHVAHVSIPSWELLAIGLFATFVENIGIYGLDNALVPIAIALALNSV